MEKGRKTMEGCSKEQRACNIDMGTSLDNFNACLEKFLMICPWVLCSILWNVLIGTPLNVKEGLFCIFGSQIFYFVFAVSRIISDVLLFCRVSLLAPSIKNLPAMQGTQVWSLGLEDPLEKGMATHSSRSGVKCITGREKYWCPAPRWSELW